MFAARARDALQDRPCKRAYICTYMAQMQQRCIYCQMGQRCQNKPFNPKQHKIDVDYNLLTHMQSVDIGTQCITACSDYENLF